MKIRGVDTILVLGMAVAMLAAGCSQTEDDGASLVLPDGDFVEVEKRLETVVTGEVKLVETMAPEDVIVAVNGYPLTKRYFEEDMAITTKSLLKRHSGNPYGVREMIEERKRMYVPQFVMKRLLIDDAKIGSLHLFIEETMHSQNLGQFWQNHVAIEYAAHSLGRKSYECSKTLEIRTAWMPRVFVRITFLYLG